MLTSSIYIFLGKISEIVVLILVETILSWLEGAEFSKFSFHLFRNLIFILAICVISATMQKNEHD